MVRVPFPSALLLGSVWLLLGDIQPLHAASLKLQGEPLMIADTLCRPKKSNGTQQVLRQQLESPSAPTSLVAEQTGQATETDLPRLLGLTLSDSTLLAEDNCEAGGGGGGAGGGSGSEGGGNSLSNLLPQSSGSPGARTFQASGLLTGDPPTANPDSIPGQSQEQVQPQAVPLESDLAGVVVLGLLGYGCYRRRR